MTKAAVIFAVLLSCPLVSSEDCAVMEYGARCDGIVLDTTAIQKAIQACAYIGRVTFPSRKTCVSLPLQLLDGTTLYLPHNATLKAGPLSLWSNQTQFNFFQPDHSKDIMILGHGTIDGSGEQWWPFNGTKPRLFHASNVTNVTFEDVNLINAPAMTLAFVTPCRNVVVRRVTITTPAVGETDGIDMGCNGALIVDTHVTNGDDSICMKDGAQNVVIQNCTTAQGIPWPAAAVRGRGDGFVLGTSTTPDMNNITFRNCTATGTLRGLTFKFRPTQNGTIRNVLMEDIVILDPQAYAMGIDLGSPHSSSLNGVGQVSVSNVTFRNIKGRANKTGMFNCYAIPCTGIVMEHINFTGGPEGCFFNNAFGTGIDVSPSSCIPPTA